VKRGKVRGGKGEVRKGRGVEMKGEERGGVGGREGGREFFAFEFFLKKREVGAYGHVSIDWWVYL